MSLWVIDQGHPSTMAKKEEEKKMGQQQSYFISVWIRFSMNLSFNPFPKPKQTRGKSPVASTD